MGEERVLDDELLGNSKRTRHGSGVDENVIVYEKRRRSLAEAFAPEGAKNTNLHVVANFNTFPRAAGSIGRPATCRPPGAVLENGMTHAQIRPVA